MGSPRMGDAPEWLAARPVAAPMIQSGIGAGDEPLHQPL